MPHHLLTFAVAAIAFLYSSVGFGGATGYLAAMALFGLPPQTMASTALILNILVASISFTNYYRAGHLKQRLLWPFLATSIPAAYLGGYLKLSDQIYYTLLYAVLTFVAIRLLFFSNPKQASRTHFQPPPFWAALQTGLGIGLLSGMVGIGGGIFLSPVIILMGWGSPKQSSAVAAAFIVLNSVSGLAGRVIGGNFVFDSSCITLIPFGLLGALGGSWFGAQRLSSLSLRRALGMVISFAVTNYWWKLLV
ncbi:MAG: sulfite exporter TauE/SafE family protein [Anaerolineales bacterium]|nr:sulfite exporter TauE/SafE family protein [Anaerolineales bacterium]